MEQKENRTLIVDGYNLFARNYVTNPALLPTGEPIGGCVGFLKSLQKLCRETRPNIIIIAWDGSGGAKRRRQANKNYKEGRKPLKLNRNVEQNLSLDEEKMNRHFQWGHLIEYLNDFPVVQILIENVEADDIIAEVARLPVLSEMIKIIVSSDQDFLQLCSNKVVVHQPIKKKTLTESRVVEEHSIHPNNFAIARAIVGDKSDNLDGVRGAGLKTLAKRIPELIEDKSFTLKQLFEKCNKEKDGQYKIFSDILLEKQKVEENYKIMQLYSPNISLSSKRHIRLSIEEFKPSFNQTSFVKNTIKDGFSDLNWSDLTLCFKRIVSEA